MTRQVAIPKGSSKCKNWLIASLTMITHMLRDPPEGSGVAGVERLVSPQNESNRIDFLLVGSYCVLAGLGLGPPWGR
ncbi:hypothetical protein KEJ18_04650 [Candidatus Bathyarchaeota archaeon]|nr:hypothetical protein [Candidatus Bathyarchaeota archaeon]